jgi:hypothetical protein
MVNVRQTRRGRCSGKLLGRRPVTAANLFKYKAFEISARRKRKSIQSRRKAIPLLERDELAISLFGKGHAFGKGYAGFEEIAGSPIGPGCAIVSRFRAQGVQTSHAGTFVTLSDRLSRLGRSAVFFVPA